jgi:hypothetical protein
MLKSEYPPFCGWCRERADKCRLKGEDAKGCVYIDWRKVIVIEDILPSNGEQMPYIDQLARDELDAGKRHPKSSGELNYLITKALIPLIPAIKGFIASQAQLRYQVFNDIFGAMFGACAEVIRRAFPEYAEYEKKKIDENGDVYPR